MLLFVSLPKKMQFNVQPGNLTGEAGVELESAGTSAALSRARRIIKPGPTNLHVQMLVCHRIVLFVNL